MKKSLLFLVFFVFGLAHSQTINIPDVNFKAALLAAGLDSNDNGNIEVSEAASLQYLAIENANISDLTGISYFTNLEAIYGNYNNLTSVNLAGLNHLTKVEFAHNQLTSFNGEDVPNLLDMYLPDNPLMSLNLTGLHNLYFLTISESQLVTIDASDCSTLWHLDLENNSLLRNLFMKNAYVQPDIILIGNPNLEQICADESEVATLQMIVSAYNYNCSVSSDCMLGQQRFKASDVELAVNSSTKELTVRFPHFMTPVSIQIFNILGAQVSNTSNPKSESIIDISTLASGIYLAKIGTSQKTFATKFVKD